MDKGFPPYPVYPKKYDTDYTLFKVYNTTESVTTSPSEQYDTIIYIRPVGVNEPEIWPTNGYATISGEVLYYDEVGYDQYTNKINALKNCLRSIGGKKSQFNPAGTDIRGFVMAEHHNQLSRGLVNLENFIGNITTEDQKTLTWRINDLANIPVLLDDYGSPEVQFVCSIENIDPASGITFNYTITILGTYTNFVLDFGDGTTEVNNLVGTHIYPPNYATNPILTINTPLTTLVLTCLSQSDQAATSISTNDFNDFLQPLPPAVVPLTFPDIPTFPDVVVPPFTPTPVVLNFPPIIFPSINIGPLGPINVPSVITIDPPIIIPSIIEFTNVPDIPSFIDITPISIPSIVTITPITFGSLGFSPLLIDTVDSVSKCYGQKTVVNADGSGDRLVKITVDNLTCNASDKVTRMSVKLEGLALAERENAPPEYGLGEIAFLIQGPDGTTCLLWANAINNYRRSGAASYDCRIPQGGYIRIGNRANTAFVDLIFADDSNAYLPRLDDLPTDLLSSGTYHPSPNTLEDNINQSANIGQCTPGSGFFYYDAPVTLPNTPWGTTLSVFNDKNPIGDWYVFILKSSQITGFGPVPADPVPYLSINNICLNFAYQPDVCFTPSSPNNPNNPSFTPGTPIPPPHPIAPNVYPSFVPALAPDIAPNGSPIFVPIMVPGFLTAYTPGEHPGIGPVIAPTVGPRSTPNGPSVGPTVGITVGPVIMDGPECVGSCIYECIGGIWTRTFNYCGSIANCVCPSSVGPCSPNISYYRIEMCGPEVGPAATPFASPFATPSVGPIVTPSVGPIVTPSVTPAVGPFLTPDITPSVCPSTTPGLTPSICPSAAPFTPILPGDQPAISLALEQQIKSFGLVTFGPAGPAATPGTPCVVPGLLPSFTPCVTPDISPAFGPHTTPSITPSVGPTTTPSVGPTTTPDVGPAASPFVTPQNSGATTPLSPEAAEAGCDSDTANLPPPLTPNSIQHSSFCIGLCFYQYSDYNLYEPGWVGVTSDCRIVNPRKDELGNVIGSCLCQMPQYSFNYDPSNPWYEPFPPGVEGQKLCKKCYYRESMDPNYPTPLTPFNTPNLIPTYGPQVGPLLIPSVAPNNAPQSAPNQENFCLRCLGYCQYTCIAGFMRLSSYACRTSDGRQDQGECCACDGYMTGLCDPRNPRTSLAIKRCVNINPTTPVSIPSMTPAQLYDGYCVWRCVYNYRYREGQWVAVDSTCQYGNTCVEPEFPPCNDAYENEVAVTQCTHPFNAMNFDKTQKSENNSLLSLSGTETYDVSEKLKLLGDKIAPNLNHTLSVQEQKNNNETVLPKNIKLTQDIQGVCYNGKWVIDVCKNESDYNSLILYEGEICDNTIEKIHGYCFKIEKTTNENTDLEFKLNLVNSGNKSKTVSIVFTDKIIEDKLLKNEQITIIDNNSIDNFAVAEPPKTENLNILYHEDKPKYDIKIENEKNQEEIVSITPISSPINIIFDDSSSKDIKIKLQNTEEQKTELVNNLQVIDEIKKNTIFKDISEDEKIKSPLNE